MGNRSALVAVCLSSPVGERVGGLYLIVRAGKEGEDEQEREDPYSL